jgi:hypothetical protein
VVWAVGGPERPSRSHGAKSHGSLLPVCQNLAQPILVLRPLLLEGRPDSALMWSAEKETVEAQGQRQGPERDRSDTSGERLSTMELDCIGGEYACPPRLTVSRCWSEHCSGTRGQTVTSRINESWAGCGPE